MTEMAKGLLSETQYTIQNLNTIKEREFFQNQKLHEARNAIIKLVEVEYFS